MAELFNAVPYVHPSPPPDHVVQAAARRSLPMALVTQLCGEALGAGEGDERACWQKALLRAHLYAGPAIRAELAMKDRERRRAEIAAQAHGGDDE
jgi:hypothetical protein